jgi:hypothetical protein
MAGNVSPQANMQLAVVGEFLQRLHRVHSLVEQYAAATTNHEALAQPLRRAFQQLKLRFMGAGYDSLSQLCGSMELASTRGGSVPTKIRILREAVGSLRFQLELEQRSIVTADRAAQEKAAKAAESESDQSP